LNQRIGGENDLDWLAQMSCYALANAFYKLASVDDERGINGLTPTKLFHWIQLRLFIYLVDGLMALKKFLKQNRTGTGKRRTYPYSSTRKTSLKKKWHNSTSKSSESSLPLPLSSDEEDDQEDTNSPHYLLFGPNGILSDFTLPLSQNCLINSLSLRMSPRRISIHRHDILAGCWPTKAIASIIVPIFLMVYDPIPRNKATSKAMFCC
jgi:hypothetical protein